MKTLHVVQNMFGEWSAGTSTLDSVEYFENAELAVKAWRAKNKGKRVSMNVTPYTTPPDIDPETGLIKNPAAPRALGKKQIDALILDSLFKPQNGRTLTVREAALKVIEQGAREGKKVSPAVFKLAGIKKPRQPNPLPKTENLKKAKKLYENFTGHKASQGQSIDLNVPDTLTVIGPCVAIAYECVRDGEKAQYMHEFKKRAAPLLCSSPDGSQLFLIGGDFIFRDTGINDN